MRHAPTRLDDLLRPTLRAGLLLCCLLFASACRPGRLAVIGPVPDAGATATSLERRTELTEPLRIDFDWELNEQGARLTGVGVARVEPPYRARLDLFLDNREPVLSAALVEGDLRLPYGARDDILPPPDLLWSALGIFRPVQGATLMAGERLEDGAERLRYGQADGRELHYEIADGTLRRVDLLDGSSVLEWVAVSRPTAARYPESATYRNLVDFRELKIERTGIRGADSFDPEIWDPRG